MTVKRYNILLVDPPWHFRVWHNQTGSGRSADKHYTTMSNDEIAALDIFRAADRDAALFLWVTRPKQAEIFDIVAEWNKPYPKRLHFKYRTEVFTWVKMNKKSAGYFFGLGYYSRANTEGCWLFTRGSMPVTAHDVSQLIVAPVRAHSQKPDETYGKIARLYPGARCLELFARTRRPGWDSLGHGIDGIDIGEALARINVPELLAPAKRRKTERQMALI